MFNATAIYDELKRKYHPDRFAPDETKMATANEIMTRITQCKHDKAALELLKKEAAERLGK